MISTSLSKSKYLKGWQCPKALYLEKFHPELKDEITDSQQAIFDAGHTVGNYAKQLFPGGVDATRGNYSNFGAAIAYTKELINNGTEVIYEAGFEFEDNLCYMDILVKQDNEWFAFEVKGSTSIKEYYIQDTGFQYYVITNSGLKLKDISLVHLNNQYSRVGEIDVNELFTIQSVTERVINQQPEILNRIISLKKMLSKGETPDIHIGTQCNSPYDCDFQGYCWQDIPDYSVFDIVRLKKEKKFELYEKGILHFKDIPDNYPLNKKQWTQVKREIDGVTIREQDKINKFINKLQYPLYFIDFETFQSPIPLFNKSRPYQQICFQYSIHVLEKYDGSLIHFEYLGTPPEDPRPDFIKTLIENLGDNGTILAYNKGFESGRLKEIAADFPEYKTKIDSIINRLEDLMTPFQKMHYYAPEMKGSYSIKKVLPALVPELSYKDFEINNGGLASNAYLQMQSETDLIKIQNTRNNLLKYCELDTFAMVKILEKLITK